MATDFESMSDAELEAIAGGGGEAKPAAKPAASSMESMSDAELAKIAGEPQPQVPEEENLSAFVEPAAGFGRGLLKGMVGAAGMPGDIESLGRQGLRKMGFDVEEKPYFATSEEYRQALAPSIPALQEKATTVPGKYGETIGEFTSLAGGGPRAMLKYGVLPGATSETAGQLTEGTELEPYARAAGALVGGGAGAFIPSRPNVAKSIHEAVGTATAEQLADAENLFKEAGDMGVPISRFEALQQVMGAPTYAGDLQRVVEGSGRMREFYGQRPQQIEEAGRKIIGEVSPAPERPSLIGPEIGKSAEAEHLEAARSRTERASPYYKAAETQNVAPQHVQSTVNELDRLIAEDKTGLTHGPLEELKSQLTAGGQGPLTDIANLERIRKNWRDRSELPAFAEKALDKEVGAKINGVLDNLNKTLEERSIPLRLGKEAYQQATREILDPLLAGPIGKLAKDDITTQEAIHALFPASPLAQSQGEIADAVSRLVKRNPQAARELVRAHIENTFNLATRELQSGAPQYGGANFRKALLGNPQAAANLDAAIRVLPNGANIAAGLDRFMEVMGATGMRQRPGSPTAFNEMIKKQLESGSLSSDAAEILLSAGTRWPGKIKEAYTQFNQGRNLDEIARLITDPKASAEFARLAEKNTPAEAARIMARIATLATTATRQAGSEGPLGEKRQGRADGGKVNTRDYPAKRLTRMERAVKRAQDAIALETKPLMDKPDETIAAALEIAKDK